MKFIKKLLPVFLFASLSLTTFAQKNFTADADNAFNSLSYFSAIPLYKKAYPKEKDKAKKVQILFNLGECYRNIQDFPQAEEWYRKAIKASYPDKKAQLYVAEAVKSQGRYDEAVIEFNAYLALDKGNSKIQQEIKACEQAQKWKDNPSNYDVSLEPLLNSKQYDFSPSFMDKKNQDLIFTSTREGSMGKEVDGIGGESFSDLWYSERDKKGKWSTPKPMEAPINSEVNEGGASFDAKRTTLYFTRCFIEKNKAMGCRMYTAEKKGPRFDEPVVIDLGTYDDSITFGHPCVSGDESFLIFASNMPGGLGGKDLYYAKWDKKGKSWSKPENLGSTVNTSGDEMFPFLKNDGTLYFSSNGHMGMGALDIFKAEKTGDLKWGNVANMQYPINSPSNDFGIIFDETVGFERGFFTSDRSGGKGGDDIWSFVVPPIIYAISGKVSNAETKDAIEGATVKLIGTDGSSVEVTTDANGFYEFAQKPDATRYIAESTSYTILVSKPKFFNNKGQETTVGVTASTSFVHDFPLNPISEKEIKFPEVHYDLGKADLLPDAKDSLSFLFQTLTDNPTLVIELSAHTDSRGSDKLNDDLSQRRAQSCVDYLVSKGIAADRMSAKGYGKHNLLITDEQITKLPTEEEREAAHAKNRRTVFKVLRDDYVPKSAAPGTPPAAVPSIEKK